MLFLDEAPEFARVALDALRQPLESGRMEVHRAGFTASYPARFQLVMAMNPCPCGNLRARGRVHMSADGDLRRYGARFSGPLRDRIDIELHVARVAARARRRGSGRP